MKPYPPEMNGEPGWTEIDQHRAPLNRRFVSADADPKRFRVRYWKDADGDGYGNAISSAVLCGPINGYVAANTDCDDANNAVSPGAEDIAGNSIDDNCDGVTDEGVCP